MKQTFICTECNRPCELIIHEHRVGMPRAETLKCPQDEEIDANWRVLTKSEGAE